MYKFSRYLSILIIFTSLFFNNLVLARVNTLSFTNVNDRGTYPNHLVFNRDQGIISIDLSPLPKKVKIYRALLIVHRRGNVASWPFTKLATQKIKIVPIDNKEDSLKLLPPRYNTFNCTKAVKEALKEGKKKLLLKMICFPGLGEPSFATYIDKKTKQVVLRLDVTCNVAINKKIDSVYDIKAYCKNGDTVIVWKDHFPLIHSNNITGKQFKRLLKLANNPHEIRYRIYRSLVPITPKTFSKAKLIDEVSPFTIWDPWYFGRWWMGEHHFFRSIVPRMPVANGILGNYNEGIYVYHCKRKDKAYYAVVKTIDGQEDLSSLKLGENSLKKPVAEAPGTGLVLLRKIIRHRRFHYIKDSTLYYFVKWEAPPNSNFPDTPFNYLVAVPPYKPKTGKRAVDIALHCWGGWLNTGYGWWYEAKRGALLVATNQRPYDWWTGFNENMGTLKPYTSARVYLYTQHRIKAFVNNFVASNWNIDTNHIFVTGSSMGGSGASLWGIKAGDYFSFIVSWVGVHIPSETKFKNSFEHCYGKEAWKCKYDSTNMPIFDYEDNVKWLYNHIKDDTPPIIFANGRNDHKIGWPQAWQFVKALIATKRSFVFIWNMKGHGARALFPGSNDRYSLIDYSLNQTVPAFTHCSLDTPLGDSPNKAPKSGRINYYLLWKTNNVVDSPTKWEMTIYLSKRAPKDSCTVDITPRRVHHFKIKAGEEFIWENIEDGKIIQAGEVRADKYDLITLPSVYISKKGNHIIILPKKGHKIPLSFVNPKDVFLVTPNKEFKLNLKLIGGSPPYKFLLKGNLPKGLIFDKRHRSIYGISSQYGSYPLTICVTDNNSNSISKKITLLVVKRQIKTGYIREDKIIHKWHKIIVDPSQSRRLFKIIASAPSYTKILLKQGNYKLYNDKRLIFKKPYLILTSLSKDRDKVIIDGQYKVGSLIEIKASHITISNLTLEHARWHGIHLKGGANNIKLYNLHILDCGEQLIKSNPNTIHWNESYAKFNDNVTISNCLLEITDKGRNRVHKLPHCPCYTQGIDAHAARHWLVEDNIFKDIHCYKKTAVASILFWHGSRDIIVQRNKIINCIIGIQFGEGNVKKARIYPDKKIKAGVYDSIIKNNFILGDRTFFDTGICAWACRNVKVFNNTIYSLCKPKRCFAGIDIRFKNSIVSVKNNLYYPKIVDRAGKNSIVYMSNNVRSQAKFFINPVVGNFHLKGKILHVVNAGENLAPYVIYDIDGQLRDSYPDIGADELVNIK